MENVRPSPGRQQYQREAFFQALNSKEDALQRLNISEMLRGYRAAGVLNDK